MNIGRVSVSSICLRLNLDCGFPSWFVTRILSAFDPILDNLLPDCYLFGGFTILIVDRF